VILDHGGDNDDLDIRCVWTGGAVLDVMLEFRRREQLLVVRPEESGRFSDLSRVSNSQTRAESGANIAGERTCSKDLVSHKRNQQLESADQVVRLGIVDSDAELVFETQIEHGVIAEIGTHTGGIDEDGNIVFLEDRCRTDTGEHEDMGGMHCSAAEEH